VHKERDKEVIVIDRSITTQQKRRILKRIGEVQDEYGEEMGSASRPSSKVLVLGSEGVSDLPFNRILDETRINSPLSYVNPGLDPRLHDTRRSRNSIDKEDMPEEQRKTYQHERNISKFDHSVQSLKEETPTMIGNSDFKKPPGKEKASEDVKRT
jgi:hypothetical protein